MAESKQSTHTKPSRRGGKFCVAGTANGSSCQNTSYCKDVKMHYFPSNEELRRKWVAFVRRHRHNWKPTSTSVLCSVHFEPTCYERRLDIAGIPSELQLKKNRLLKDSVPTIDAVERQIPKGPTARQRRQIKRHALSSSTTVDFEELTEVDLESEMPHINEDAETGIEMQSQPTESDVVEVPKTVPCGNCSILKLKIRRYQQNIYKLKIKKQHLKDQIQTVRYMKIENNGKLHMSL
ncbi:THAP domain-containing protein 2-like [Rhopilema esculentum]|uniref:THAP domain-containing protein 2-like n=1 Tax=Rhopilema esculentum TaxID=499914 RepID=UPI0031DB45AF